MSRPIVILGYLKITKYSAESAPSSIYQVFYQVFCQKSVILVVLYITPYPAFSPLTYPSGLIFQIPANLSRTHSHQSSNFRFILMCVIQLVCLMDFIHIHLLHLFRRKLPTISICSEIYRRIHLFDLFRWNW